MQTRFTIGTTIGGFEVIDSDGRPVSPAYAIRRLALDVRDELNEAARRGKLQLRHALGAVEQVA